MEYDQGGTNSEHAVHCIKQLSAIPSSLSICHWAKSSEILSQRLDGEFLEEGENDSGMSNLEPMLNRVAVGGRSLLQLSTVNFDRISSFYNISRTNLVDIGWSRGSHTLLGLTLSGSANIYVGLKGRHWQMSSRFRSHNVAGCCLEWLGDSSNLFALGFQNGEIKLVDGEALRECSGINISSSEEQCTPIWSACVTSSPIRDMQSRNLGSDGIWANNELLLAFDDGTISHLDFRAKISQCNRTQTLSKGLSCIRWNPHDNNVFSTGCRNGVQIWDIRKMDGITSTTSIKSQFVVGKARWRPGFPSQIAFCCSAIDSAIYVYDLLDPIRPIQRFSRHTDVVRDFDWLESDAIMSCGADKKLILSVWEDAAKPNRKIKTSSCLYTPNFHDSIEASQRVVFNISHEFFRKTVKKNFEIYNNPVSGETSNSNTELKKQNSDFKSKVRELMDKSDSIFKFCSERNELFKYSLYSVTGFLPDIGLVQFPGDLASILDPRCELERRLHIHELNNRKSDWIRIIHRLGVFGLTPSWSSIFSSLGSTKVHNWKVKWGPRIIVHKNKSISELNGMVYISSGRGEDPRSFLFNRDSLKKLTLEEKVECIFEFFLEVFGIKILQEQRYMYIIKKKCSLKETIEAISNELNLQSNMNNVVICLLIVNNLLPCITPPDSPILKSTILLQLKLTLSLINFLRKLGLFCLSSQLIKSSQIKKIRNLGRENISESNFYCGSIIQGNEKDSFFESKSYCERQIKSEKALLDKNFQPRTDLHSCLKCNSSKNICVVCSEPVLGLWVGCPCCRHGGHPKHIKEWFLSNSICPSGCGHLCLY
ncbi:unnamed protein product [Cryptosporidium hominis]|uniref:WD40 repeat containing protein n=2 Tax=Cryptosporidium hominis TaxID=237895 RepID=A0A0S4TAJ9_CRYHO|nr:WD repeat-containing protein 24 [Cryptosporidium hominis]PPA65672.1 WD domain G-beta repeat family protein [Cryptosporidium hominis]PPS97260.1 WD40 repeat containing protein [Cryptosporidium hominis]CUV04248.1 unnamed protein product [Cryptosporidium hominis]|eukprot:PPS97260.1 WD40 repeat containing protein [Cryptosporidium hominis]